MKLNISKIEATHLLFDMWDQQEEARKSVKTEDQAAVPDRTSGKEHGSGRELPHGLLATLPDRPGKDRMPTICMDPTPEAPKQDIKCPHDDDEITEVLDKDEPAEPPKKKKKKKKNKDPKEAVPTRKGEDDGVHPSTLMVRAGDMADEATPVPVSTEVPAEDTKAPKKKKQKKDAKLERFWLEQQEARAKEMSMEKHRKPQREQDFWALWNYRKSIPGALLETINGADHTEWSVSSPVLPNTLLNRPNASKRLSRLLSPPFRWCRGCPVGTSVPRNLLCVYSWTVKGTR